MCWVISFIVNQQCKNSISRVMHKAAPHNNGKYHWHVSYHCLGIHDSRNSEVTRLK